MLEKINPQDHESFGEIGAGDGILTVPLARSCAKLVAIEVDPRLFALLKKNTAQHANVTLIFGDALTADTRSVLPTNARLVGNLPYNRSVAIIEKYLQRAQRADTANTEDMHFLVQREIAQRLFAEPGTKDYGRLSLLRHWHATGETLFEVPPEAFSPPPKVWSGFIRLKTHHRGPELKNDPELKKLIRAVFHRKHRKLANNLDAYANAKGLLDEMGIADKRALDVTPSEIIELFKKIKKQNTN